jgi:cytochrome c-type biogenesis protein CcmH/NrfF
LSSYTVNIFGHTSLKMPVSAFAAPPPVYNLSNSITELQNQQLKAKLAHANAQIEALNESNAKLARALLKAQAALRERS